jgi:hypothetical protein
MILYNITINVENAVHDEWLDFMTNHHIRDVMNTGMFTENRMYKVLGDEDSGGTTYSIQYLCETMEKFRQYEDIYAPALRNDHDSRFRNKFVAFRTLLEKVDG